MYVREFDEELPSDGEFNMNGCNCIYCDSESELNNKKECYGRKGTVCIMIY